MKAKSRRSRGPSIQTQVRMNGNLRTRIREYQKVLYEQTGVDVTFGMAIRTLIEKGLRAG